MSLLFSAQELADLEALALQAMPEEATVARRTATRGPAGGTTWVYAPVGTVPCGWMAVSRERNEPLGGSGGPNAISSGRLRLPHAVDVRAEDRLTVDGVLWEVTGLEARGTTWAGLQIAQVTRVH